MIATKCMSFKKSGTAESDDLVFEFDDSTPGELNLQYLIRSYLEGDSGPYEFVLKKDSNEYSVEYRGIGTVFVMQSFTDNYYTVNGSQTIAIASKGDYANPVFCIVWASRGRPLVDVVKHIKRVRVPKWIRSCVLYSSFSPYTGVVVEMPWHTSREARSILIENRGIQPNEFINSFLGDSKFVCADGVFTPQQIAQ